jgi:predicted  nucleic acid-binding Zn-ribbon protein
MKARELERDLSAKDETNGQLQTALREANESLEEMQLTIENLTRAHDRAVSPLQEQLSAAEEEATKLKTALEEKGQII